MITFWDLYQKWGAACQPGKRQHANGLGVSEPTLLGVPHKKIHPYRQTWSRILQHADVHSGFQHGLCAALKFAWHTDPMKRMLPSSGLQMTFKVQRRQPEESTYLNGWWPSCLFQAGRPQVNPLAQIRS